MYYVYVHTVPNGKMYIGQSKEIDSRWNSGEGYVDNRPFYKDILMYGWEHIKHEIIAELPDREGAVLLESILIAILKTENEVYGYNQTKFYENAIKRYSARIPVNKVTLKKRAAEESFFEASGLPLSACENLIDEWIFNKLHREICKDRLIDGMTYDDISKKYQKSERRVKDIIYKCCKKIDEHF